jgi:hypothetical protein
MPTSYFQAVPAVVNEVLKARPSSVLELGVGFGKYGVVLREVLDIQPRRYNREDWQAKIDGVEGFAAYRNPVHDHVYSRVYYGLIEDVLPGLGMYDAVLMVDVIEHFDKRAGRKVLEEAIRHASKAVIVSTPVEPAVLKPYLGNELDTHKSKWMPEDFAGVGGCQSVYNLVKVGAGGAYVITLSKPSK